MIHLKLQIILIIICLILLFVFVNAVRKYRMELRYTLLWLLIILVNLLFGIFPAILEKVSLLFSVDTPSNLLFLSGIAALFMISFSLTSALSNYSIRVKGLSQELAMLKYEVEQLRVNAKQDIEMGQPEE